MICFKLSEKPKKKIFFHCFLQHWFHFIFCFCFRLNYDDDDYDIFSLVFNFQFLVVRIQNRHFSSTMWVLPEQATNKQTAIFLFSNITDQFHFFFLSLIVQTSFIEYSFFLGAIFPNSKSITVPKPKKIACSFKPPEIYWIALNQTWRYWVFSKKNQSIRHSKHLLIIL